MPTLPELTPESLDFVLLSFEGPDQYSLAGGLGVRMKELALELAREGFRTHLVFIGDPRLPAEESPAPNLTLHRWAQWLSASHEAGVYDGEEAKLADWNSGVPEYVTKRLVAPAAEAGRLVAILAEEWHTAYSACELSDRLWTEGLRDDALILWNANNIMGFDRIDWGRLAYCAQLTTVSRYMKHVMWARSVNPLVIPNGIPTEQIRDADPALVGAIRQAIPGDELIFKVGRFSPDKRWLMAVDALANEKKRGHAVTAIFRGGLEPHGGEVLARARANGLVVSDIALGHDLSDVAVRLRRAAPADIYNVTDFMPRTLVSTLHSAADAVLANSGHEPFGLVGLEVMAAGGVAFVGATGEDYAVSFFNSVVLDTDDPMEINVALDVLRSRPDVVQRLRADARETARAFTWENVVSHDLLNRLAYVALNQLVISPPGESAATSASPGEVLVPRRVHDDAVGSAHSAVTAGGDGGSVPGHDPTVDGEATAGSDSSGSVAYGGEHVDGRLAISPFSQQD